MKYLILFFLFLISCLVSAAYSKASLIEPKSSHLANSIFIPFPPTPQDRIPILPGSLRSQIRQELYDSISTGMSYEEVRAIIGWDGIAIYENELDTPQGKIKERVYQWDSADLYNSNYTDLTTSYPALYWSVTLQFQNNILIEKSSLNLPP